MNAVRYAKTVEYTVAPIDSTGIYRLSVTIDSHPPITIQSLDILLLARLGRLITYNKMLHHKASELCDQISNGKIPMGSLPNYYLYPGLAYRVVISYRSDNGVVCAHYTTPQEAFNSTHSQKEIIEAYEKYGYKYDYNQFLSAMERGKPYTILHCTIVYGRITHRGDLSRCPTQSIMEVSHVF